MSLEVIIEKTKEYLAMPSVVGHERFFMDFLYREYKGAGFSAFKYDAALEVHGNDPNSRLICAHIDRHGLISLGDDEYVYAAQYIKEIKYGENNLSSRKEVENIASRFEGERVYAYNDVSGAVLSRGIIEACFPNMLNNDALFYLDEIGRLEQNVPLAYERQASYENGILKGQIDNVISLAVVYALFQNGYQGTVLFTCEEEIGKSWIPIAKYLDGSRNRSDAVIVLDTSPYSDAEILERGPLILRNRDKSEVFNPVLVEAFKERCRALQIPFCVKDEDLLAAGKVEGQLGSTELGRLVQGTNGTCTGATVQVPTLMYHTSNETTSDIAIQNYYRFLDDILIKNPINI